MELLGNAVAVGFDAPGESPGVRDERRAAPGAERSRMRGLPRPALVALVLTAVLVVAGGVLAGFLPSSPPTR